MFSDEEEIDLLDNIESSDEYVPDELDINDTFSGESRKYVGT